MYDELSQTETVVLALAAVAVLAVGVGVGMTLGGAGGTDGAAPNDTASEQEIRQAAEQYVEQTIAQQRVQLEAAANRTANLSSDDVSIEASVVNVTRSDIGGLYEVAFRIEGQVPSRVGGETQPIDQTSSVYLSPDGRYLFQRPIDLERPRGAPTGAGGAPAGP